MGRIVKAMDSPLRLLVASIRQTSDLVTLAERGMDTFTILPPLIEELLENELTRLGSRCIRSGGEVENWISLGMRNMTHYLDGIAAALLEISSLLL